MTDHNVEGGGLAQPVYDLGNAAPVLGGYMQGYALDGAAANPAVPSAPVVDGDLEIKVDSPLKDKPFKWSTLDNLDYMSVTEDLGVGDDYCC